MGKDLIFGLLVASTVLAGIVSRADADIADTHIQPSATPKRRNVESPSATPLPTKAKQNVGGTGDGKSISPVGDAPSESTQQITPSRAPGRTKAPATGDQPELQIISPNRRKGGNTNGSAARSANSRVRNTKNQDIEVENDETHIVGHDRKKTGTPSRSADRTSTPRNTRTETVDNNETISISSGNSGTIRSGSTPRVRRPTMRKGSHKKSVRRKTVQKAPGKSGGK